MTRNRRSWRAFFFRHPPPSRHFLNIFPQKIYDLYLHHQHIIHHITVSWKIKKNIPSCSHGIFYHYYHACIYGRMIKKYIFLSLPNHRINAYHLSHARKKYLMASFCLFSRETTAKQSAFKLRSLSRRPLPKARRAGRTSVKLQIRQYMTLFLHCIFFHVISVY